jgi:CheY-like chemotaxis protein
MVRNQRRRFLIVDNDEQESGVLVQLFKSLGQEASATWSGRNALEYLASNQLDLLMVDQHVADMYVGDLIERVLRLPNHPRVAIMRSVENINPLSTTNLWESVGFLKKGSGTR